MLKLPEVGMDMLRRLAYDRQGAVAVTLALSLLPLCVATLGALDMTSALRAKTQLGDALDAAALAAAKDGGQTDAAVDADGRRMLAEELADLGAVPDLTVSFRLAEAGTIVVAEATRTVETSIYEKVIGKPVSVAARTRVLREGPGPCVIALNPTAAKSLWISGSFEVTMPECVAWVNSTSPSAFEMAGASRMEARAVNVVGGSSLGGALNAKLNQHVQATPDPFERASLPRGGACDVSETKPNGATRFNAGARTFVFCGGLPGEGRVLHFGPGVYEIRGGPFGVNDKTVLHGQNVTFLLTDGAALQINGGADIKLSAPKTGPLAGLLFFQERVARSTENRINGGAGLTLDGSIYLPKQSVRFNGNANMRDSCLSLVADTIEWIGNASLELKSCEGGLSRVRLLE